MSRYWLSMKSAEAWVVRHSSSEPGKLQATSPLPSQSNSGPTPSLSSAMNPSRETTAPMIVLPTVSSLPLRSATTIQRLRSRRGSIPCRLASAMDPANKVPLTVAPRRAAGPRPPRGPCRFSVDAAVSVPPAGRGFLLRGRRRSARTARCGWPVSWRTGRGFLPPDRHRRERECRPSEQRDGCARGGGVGDQGHGALLGVSDRRVRSVGTSL
jgi:hypothetical protein